MKRTNQELDQMLDQAAADIRNDAPDAQTFKKAADRVWGRLQNLELSDSSRLAEAATSPEQIRTCADFQALIPDYLQSYVSGPRALLIEDHMSECIPCRKALKTARAAARGEYVEAAPKAPVRAPRSIIKGTAVRWAIAATLILGFGLIAYPLGSAWMQRFWWSVGTLHAVVQAANGQVYRVADARSDSLTTGAALGTGERIRTAKGAEAVVRLNDGSTVEMDERSEFSLTENAQGTTIHLNRGKIIVQAAPQRSRKLFVATPDSLVSVTGTVFSVNSGTKGSRVSVVHGQVVVDHSGEKKVLGAGEQMATHQSIAQVPVRDEISWSRDAGRYAKLLQESARVGAIIDSAVSMPEVRYSTRLLDLMPAGTILYAGIPNVSSTVGQASQMVESQIGENPTLRQWWQSEGSSKHEAHLHEVIKQVSDYGKYLGPELAIGAQHDSVLALAEVRDTNGLQAQIGQASSSGPQIRLVQDPRTAQSGTSEESGNLYVWLTGDLVAASPSLTVLRSFQGTLANPTANPFAASPFRARLAEVYGEGAAFLVAADLEKIVSRTLSTDNADGNSAQMSAAFEQLGLTRLKYFIGEMKEVNGKPQNHAVVTFDDAQRGLPAWLAAPGPMGALQFISPDANFVAGFVVKQPAAVLDDVLGFLQRVNPDLSEHFKEVEAQSGIDLRNDLAAPLGGEFAFALDGPILPTPAWKLVAEVYDTDHLQQTIEKVLKMANDHLTQLGKPLITLVQSQADGRTYYSFKCPESGQEVDYAYVSGYLIAAPSRAIIEQAIRYRDSGTTLLQSARFRASLPEDKQANFSALVYQNLAPAIAPIADQFGSQLPEAQQQKLRALASVGPSLAYAYALGDRITVSVNNDKGAMALTPSALLGLPGSFNLGLPK